MRRACVVLALLIIGAGLGSSVTANAAPPKPPKPTTAQDIANLRATADSLQKQINLLATAVVQLKNQPAGMDYGSRVTTLEGQVGVSSFNRMSFTSLWDEIASVKQAIGGLSYSTIDSRVRKVERCVSAIQLGWRNSNAPIC